jgi:hypothetical protein
MNYSSVSYHQEHAVPTVPKLRRFYEYEHAACGAVNLRVHEVSMVTMTPEEVGVGLRGWPQSNVEKIVEAVIRATFYFRKGVRMLQLWNKRTIGYQWCIVNHVRRRRYSVWSKLHLMVLCIFLLRRYIIRKWSLKASAFFSNVCWRCFYLRNLDLTVYFCWHNNFVCEVRVCYYSVGY